MTGIQRKASLVASAKAKHPIVLPIFALAATGALLGCEWNDVEGPKPDAGAVTRQEDGSYALRLQVHSATLEGGLSATWSADSLVVTLTGEGLETRRLNYAGTSATLVIPEMVPGSRPTVEVEAFSHGSKRYQGRVETWIDPMRKTPVDLVLHPCFGRVRAQVLLAALDTGIVSGRLTLTAPGKEFVGQWQRKGAYGLLVADTLPEAGAYDLAVDLVNAQGKVLYAARQGGVAVTAGKESQVAVQLVPTQVSQALSMTLLPAAEMQVRLQVPAALRAPQKPGELQLTEAYPIPSDADSGSEGEWLEIMNASADSLSLAGCRISRDRQTGDTRSLRLDSAAQEGGRPGVLAPGEVLTLGRRASQAGFKAPAFSLVNTMATLWLTCRGDSSVQDTVRYDGSGKSAGAVPVREGEVLMRRPSTLGGVGRDGDWCVTAAAGKDGAWGATPGRIFPACGED